jgi:hypothetical protein
MSTTIQIKRSYTASAVPLAGDLAVGELAVNLADKRLFAKQADGTIIELSTNPTDLDAATLRIDGVEITASATELNSLDGLTATTAELNILDGVTATATEINVLDGITSTTTELNKLDGFTGSTAELNLLDGVTATTSELNVLDGITATTTELNYTDGVTSNIQTQLNGKATSAQGALADSAVQPDDDVTLGTVTADGLSVENNTGSKLTFTSTDTTIAADDVIGEIDFYSSDASGIGAASRANISAVSADGAGAGDVYIKTSTGGAVVANRIKVANNGDVSFYEDTGTTAKFVWDASAEKLSVSSQIELSNVDGKITWANGFISGGNSYGDMRHFGDRHRFYSEDGSKLAINIDVANNKTEFYTSGTERMRINSSGNVGIGTASPRSQLDISDSDSANGTKVIVDIKSTAVSVNNNASFSLYELGTEHGRFQRARDGSATVKVSSLGSNNLQLETLGSGKILFNTNNAERARIDSSGNLLVGTTSSNAVASSSGGTTTGVETQPSGELQVGSNGDKCAIFNRQSSAGEIVRFRKDGSTIGSIGVDSNAVTFDGAAANVGLRMGGVAVLPRKSSADSDGQTSLGTSGARFKDLYLSGGVYLGGTGAANKLDDYETGEYVLTITPSVSGSVTLNSSFSQGSYTKIGNKVTCTGLAIVSAISSPVGNIEINLPFAIVAGTDRRGDVGVSLAVSNVQSGSCSDVMGVGTEGKSNFVLKDCSGTAFTEFDSKITSATQIYFSITYLTSA